MAASSTPWSLRSNLIPSLPNPSHSLASPAVKSQCSLQPTGPAHVAQPLPSPATFARLLSCHPPSCEEHCASHRAPHPLLPQLLAPALLPSGAVLNPYSMLHTHLFMPLPLSTSISVLITAWPIQSCTDLPLLDGNSLPTAVSPTRVGLAPVLFSAVSLVLRAWCTAALQQTCLWEPMNDRANACWYRTLGTGARLTEESCSLPT